MDKVVVLVRARSGSAEQSQRDSAFDLVEGLARSAAASDRSPAGLVVSRVERAFDETDPLLALIELWQTSGDAGQAVAALLPDDRRHELDATVTVATCSEIVFKEVKGFAEADSPWKVKLAGTAFRRDDFTPDAFFEYWTHTHAPIGGNVPGVGGYTVSRVGSGALGEEQADALIEQWYTDITAFEDAQSTDQAKAAWEDVGNYAKTTGTAFWLMGETVLVRPPATGPGTLEA